MNKDSKLKKRLDRYDTWIREGRIPFSSQVIPVHESIHTLQWVLPTQQVHEILRNARTFALTNCECRQRYGRCDHPVEVCFLINDMADIYLKEKKGKKVSLDEAYEILQKSNALGLVHLTIYNPDQYVYAVCSCCPCCCHDLQFMRLYERGDLIAHADYIIETDTVACVNCGKCVHRCYFNARWMEDKRLVYRAENCYGCGLCVTVCSSEANRLNRRS